MAQIGQGERLTDATFSIDSNNLSFARGFTLWHLKGDVFMGFISQPLIEILQIWHFIFHDVFSQLSIIFRQDDSRKAVS